MWVLASDIAVWVGLFTSALFVILYLILAHPFRSEEGAHIITFTAWIACVLTWITCAGFVRAEPPTQPVLRLIIFGVLDIFLIWRMSILIRRQILDHRRARDS